MEKIFCNMNWKDKEYILQKTKTVGLYGSVGLVMALSIMKAISTATPDTSFSYDQNMIATYDENVNVNLANQYEQFLKEKGEDADLSFRVEKVLNSLANYIIAKNEYEDMVSYMDASELTPYRVNLVSGVSTLRVASQDMVKAKMIDYFDLSSSTPIEIILMSNSADGPSYIIRIGENGSEYIVQLGAGRSNNIDSELSRKCFKLLNLSDELNYNGDGSNDKAWDKKTTKKYIDIADELFYMNLELAKDNSKFEVVESKDNIK